MDRALVALIALSTSISMGCDVGGGGSRQSTPQEAAHGFQEAASALDWARAFGYLTEKGKADMIGAAFITGAYGAQIDHALTLEFSQIAVKYGLDDKDADLREADNLTEIFVELVDWIEHNLPVEQGRNAFSDAGAEMAATVFSEFEIDGDQAYATMTSPKRTRRTRLTKIDGLWYMDI